VIFSRGIKGICVLLFTLEKGLSGSIDSTHPCPVFTASTPKLGVVPDIFHFNVQSGTFHALGIIPPVKKALFSHHSICCVNGRKVLCRRAV